MNKGSRLVGTAAAIWSRRSLQCTERLAAPVNVALQAQLNLFKVCHTHSIALMTMAGVADLAEC